jgi:hypothetical protein
MEPTLATARARYYEANQFGTDGGDSLPWVTVKVLGIPLKIPNTAARKRAVRIHDLHHVLTGYQTDLRGESEIAAWELATGCRAFPAALVLNSVALGMGLAIAPVRCMRAWARGRASANLYRADNANRVDHLLPREVAAMQRELRLDGPAPRIGVRDVAATLALGLPMLAMLAAPVVVVALAIFAIIH